MATKIRKMGFKGFLFSFSSDDMNSELVKKRRLEAGMDGVLGKPFHSEKFKTLIAAYFDSKAP